MGGAAGEEGKFEDDVKEMDDCLCSSVVICWPSMALGRIMVGHDGRI